MKRKDPILSGQVRLIISISFVYVLAWFAFYGRQSAGIYPGPEETQFLKDAISMARGSSTDVGGYSLYTFVLSILARFSVDELSLIKAARGLNAIALLFAAGFAASTAGRYWKRNRPVWASGLLVGLNPVLVFWAGIVSPCLLATACIATTLWKIIPWLKGPSLKSTFWIGVLLTFAAAFESTLLLFAICWPFLAFFYSHRERNFHGLLALLAPALIGGLLFVSGFQLQSPIAFDFDEFGIHAYGALANHEAYDGKSYTLFRELHALLLYNPIHWGALFLFLGGGLYIRIKDDHSRRSVYFCIGALIIFTVSHATNDGASQARATMIPLMAIFGSGIFHIAKIWKHASRQTKQKIILGGSTLALFVYSSHFGFIQHRSWESDYASLAISNLENNKNELAATWARKALELNPQREDLKDIIIRAEFNEWALASQPKTLPIEQVRGLLDQALHSSEAAHILSIHGIYYYKLKDVDKAIAIWRANKGQSPLAILCLYWTGSSSKPSKQEVEKLEGLPYYELLIAALAVNRSEIDYSAIEARLDNILAFAY